MPYRCFASDNRHLEDKDRLALDSLVWMSRRQYELYLFHYFQSYVNKLDTLSMESLSRLATEMLQLLTLSCADTQIYDYKTKVRALLVVLLGILTKL